MTRHVPSGIALLVAVVGVAGKLPWVGLVSLGALVAFSPIAVRLSSRLILWTVGLLATAGAMSLVPSPVPFNEAVLGALLALGYLGSIGISRLSQPIGWRPRVSADDGILAGGALALAAVLALPFAGMGASDVVLDLARGFDHLNHFSMITNIQHQGSLSWDAPDGSGAVGAGYPLGFHLMAAVLMSLGAPSDSLLLNSYALVMCGLTATAALLVGWVATAYAVLCAKPDRGRRSARIAAIIMAVFMPLGGLFSGMYEVGHAPFLVPVAVCVAGSWLALSQRQDRRAKSIVVLLAMGVGIAGTYPLLLVGLGPPLFVALVGRRSWLSRTEALMVGVAFILGLVVLYSWRSSLRWVAVSDGEYSTPIGTSLLMVFLALCCALMVRGPGPLEALMRGTPVVLGFVVAAVGLGAVALVQDFPPLSNYYVAKMLQATWVASLPVLVGALSVVIAVAGQRRNSRSVMALALAMALLLSMVPDGRYSGPGGLAMLLRRLTERDRALGTVQIVEASSLIGSSWDGRAAVMLEPAGWSFRVAHEGPGYQDWVRSAGTASMWLNALRGVRSVDQDEIARCLNESDPHALRCAEAWLGEDPQRHLDLVAPSAGPLQHVATLSEAFDGRVRSIDLSSGLR